jgi:hypothetical protein
MSLTSHSSSAASDKNPVGFTGEPGPGAMIDQYLPQPGQLVGSRILQIEDISESWFLPAASEAGTPWSEQYGLQKVSGVWQVKQPETLTAQWVGRYSKVSKLPTTSRRSLELQINANLSALPVPSGAIEAPAHNIAPGRNIGRGRRNPYSAARLQSAPDESGNTEPVDSDIPQN